MVEKDGRSHLAMGKCTGDRCRMRWGGSPDKQTPAPTAWPYPAMPQQDKTGRLEAHPHPYPRQCQLVLGTWKTEQS